jgi:hypothetical protein
LDSHDWLDFGWLSAMLAWSQKGVRSMRNESITIAVAVFFATQCSSAFAAETYRLVHAIGNTERVTARNLTKAECEARKRELMTVAEALGTYNPRTGYGSITCLPESLFND